jgi:hypothetical protein
MSETEAAGMWDILCHEGFSSIANRRFASKSIIGLALEAKI